VDLYRIESLQALESTGLVEYLTGSMIVTAIEWADKALAWLPDDRLEIELRHLAVGSRTVRLLARGPVSTTLLFQTKAAFGRYKASTRKRRTEHNRA
jgi:tRNA A37 threonylcarbamoyladenosine biosynthesis protein TsaE